MIELNTIERLTEAFPDSFVNPRGEFIAHVKANQYFMLSNCETELDVQCKALEWLSRGAYKTEPFETERKNRQFQEFMLCGINEFLKTNFTADDMELIYTYLGNACNHQKTMRFIESGYDMSILKTD